MKFNHLRSFYSNSAKEAKLILVDLDHRVVAANLISRKFEIRAHMREEWGKKEEAGLLEERGDKIVYLEGQSQIKIFSYQLRRDVCRRIVETSYTTEDIFEAPDKVSINTKTGLVAVISRLEGRGEGRIIYFFRPYYGRGGLALSLIAYFSYTLERSESLILQPCDWNFDPSVIFLFEEGYTKRLCSLLNFDHENLELERSFKIIPQLRAPEEKKFPQIQIDAL